MENYCNFIAHEDDDGNTQALEDHLVNVAELCSEHAMEQLKPLAYSIGLSENIPMLSNKE